MSNAEHLVENLIMGMKDGRPADEIILYKENQDMLNDIHTGITGDEAVRIACHVVWSLYDGRFPED